MQSYTAILFVYIVDVCLASVLRQPSKALQLTLLRERSKALQLILLRDPHQATDSFHRAVELLSCSFQQKQHHPTIREKRKLQRLTRVAPHAKQSTTEWSRCLGAINFFNATLIVFDATLIVAFFHTFFRPQVQRPAHNNPTTKLRKRNKAAEAKQSSHTHKAINNGKKTLPGSRGFFFHVSQHSTIKPKVEKNRGSQFQQKQFRSHPEFQIRATKLFRRHKNFFHIRVPNYFVVTAISVTSGHWATKLVRLLIISSSQQFLSHPGIPIWLL